MNLNKKEFIYSDSKGENITTEIIHVVFDNFSDLVETLDNEFVDIIHADSAFNLTATKREIKNLIKDKSQKQKYGIVAEFFAHIVLRQLGYNQECLFKNLEENSMKKGFDGLYEIAGNFWLMESKSAYTNSIHKDKIKEATNDLKDRIENFHKNNPWLNAVYHISSLENGKRNETLKNQIRNLSLDYSNGIKHDLREFRIIPVSTLFVKNIQILDEMVESIKLLLEGNDYKDIIIVCIDHYVYKEFLEYLEI